MLGLQRDMEIGACHQFSMGDPHGIILDLRGNSGGEIESMPYLFLRERTLLDLRKARDGENKAFFEPAAI